MRIKYLFIFLFWTNAFFAQKIVVDTILVNTKNSSTLTMDGEIMSINPEKEIKTVNEAFVLEGKTIISIIANKKFKNYASLNIISNKNVYYNLIVKFSEENFSPYFFLDKKDIPESQKFEEEKKVNETELKKIKEIAKYINSEYYKKDFTKTKHIKNGIMVSLINSYVINNKLFLKFEIDNSYAYGFYSDQIVFKTTKEDSYTEKSFEENIITPMYRYKEDRIEVKPLKKINITFVFNTFKIPEDKHLKFSILENNSTTEYGISIPAKFINQPKMFNFKSQNNSKPSNEKSKENNKKKNNRNR